MKNNIINHLQPATKQQNRKLFRFYPTEANTTEKLVIDSDIDDRLISLAAQNGIEIQKQLVLCVSDEAVDAMKTLPIKQRPVSWYVRSLVDVSDYNGGCMPLGNLLELQGSLAKYNPQVAALRTEQSFIEKKRMEDELPIFTPCCVLQYLPETRTYHPVKYTCLLDFDIRQEDNPAIDLDELKPELAALPQMAYCGLATNGIDLFCIVPISTPQRYAAHAMALRHLFKQKGIIIRVAESITHTRTLSSDPNGYFNENAVEFTKFLD